MRKSLLVIVLIGLLMWYLFQVVGAQEKSSDKIAQTPAPASTNQPPAGEKKLKAIWDYDKELGLSQDQVKQIKELVIALSKELSSLQEKLKASNQELVDMINKEASLDQIKLKLQKIAAIEVEMRYSDIKFSRKINHVLSKEQLDKWHKIQAEARSKGK